MQMPIIVEDEIEDDTEVQEVQPLAQEAQTTHASPLKEGGICHVYVVEETKVNVKEWHISRLPKTSIKCCSAQ